MSWITFLLGRPGMEYSFEINPEGMQIEESAITVTQRNLAGDLKKSTLKVSAPIIKINSSFLSLTQRNQFNSLVGVSDTFLSFQTRNDWQQVNDLATVIDSTHVQLQNSSALRLSQVLVLNGYASIITISTAFQAGEGYGAGPYGGGGYGATTFQPFNPGTVTYDDTTMIVTFTNPLPTATSQVLITYTYTGWLVNMEKFTHNAKGGWIDRFTYDFQLIGA